MGEGTGAGDADADARDGRREGRVRREEGRGAERDRGGGLRDAVVGPRLGNRVQIRENRFGSRRVDRHLARLILMRLRRGVVVGGTGAGERARDDSATRHAWAKVCDRKA